MNTFDFYLFFYLLGALVNSILATIASILYKGLLKYKPEDMVDCFVIGGFLWPITIWIVLFALSKKLWIFIVKIVRRLLS